MQRWHGVAERSEVERVKVRSYHHGLADEQQQQSLLCVLLRAKQTVGRHSRKKKKKRVRETEADKLWEQTNGRVCARTSLPSTTVGVGSGCSSCCEGVLAAWDRPVATPWAGPPEETSSSVHTSLGAGSLQAVWR